MPVYTNNGSTNLEIGRIEVSNGTANSQIGKVYESNGTTNSLIYTADETVYPGYAVTNATSGSPVSAGAFYGTVNQANGGWARAYIPINVTNWNTLTLTYSWSSQTYTYTFIGLCTGFTGDGNPWSMNNQGLITRSAVLKITNYDDAGGTVTTALDVSALSGTYYLAIQIRSGSSVSSYGTASITSAVLS